MSKRAYIIPYDRQMSFVYLGLKTDGDPMLFGGGLKPNEQPFDAACREMREESGYRFSWSKTGQRIWNQTIGDYYFFAITGFADKRNCPGGSTENAACIPYDAKSLHLAAIESQSASEFAKRVVRGINTIINIGVGATPTLGKAIPNAKDNKNFTSANWHSSEALWKFAKEKLSYSKEEMELMKDQMNDHGGLLDLVEVITFS